MIYQDSQIGTLLPTGEHENFLKSLTWKYARTFFINILPYRLNKIYLNRQLTPSHLPNNPP